MVGVEMAFPHPRGGLEYPMACPICTKPADAKYRPFCSKRCADLDLGKWLGGGYAIPGDDIPDEDNMPGPDAPQRPH